ncbi:MAG: exodeoxyribonuclease VII small subunit [Bacteroidales bacterium]|nr:exodeoxyribonuclease VII small subunit [Bacteroidales bacterium]MCD8394099.1 exodeoxyribonuclease VII small subunit [Bacteroidales bacterium]
MEEITYNQAISELETILQTMQSDRCDIDKLSALTRRAADLIKLCRTRLTATDQELQEILASLQNG